MPKGAAMVQTMQRWIEDEEERRGYMRTKTPLMAKKDLYVISDHWGHYKKECSSSEMKKKKAKKYLHFVR